MNQELVEYVKKAKEAADTDEEIKSDLVKSGWRIEDVNSALLDLNKDDNRSEDLEMILAFFRVVSLAYILIVPIFLLELFSGGPQKQRIISFLLYHFIVSAAQPTADFISGIFYGPLSIIGGILGLISIKLIKKKNSVGLIILTILVALAILLTIGAWSLVINPYYPPHTL